MLFTGFRKYLTSKNIILFLIFTLFFISLRWNSFTAPFERDEGEYAYSAWIMRRGIMPYENSFPYKPPMVIYTYYLSQVVLGDHIFSPRVIAVIFSFLTIILIGLIAKHEFGSSSGWISMFLLSLMLILPVNFGGGMLADVYYAANTEIFMILPLTIVLLLYVFGKGKSSHKIWLVSGILSAIAVNYKPICFLILAYIYIFWIIKTWIADKNILRLIINLFLLLVGGAVTSFIIYLPFLLSDGGRAVWDQLVNFTSCYATGGNWQYGIGQLLNRIMIMGKYYWLIYLLFLYYLIKRPKYWVFYTGLLAVSFVSIYVSIIGHYFIQIMPFLALIGGYSLHLLSKEKLLSRLNLGVMIAVVIFILTYPIRSIFTKSPKELGMWVYGNLDPYYEAEEVGKRMMEITKPDDFVYVEGEDPEINYFSQRVSSVKIEATSFYASECKMVSKYTKASFEDLKNRPPAAIVICVTGSCSYLWREPKMKPYAEFLSNMLDSKYELVGGWIPDRGGYWLEPMSSKDIPSARSILYRRK